MINSTLIKLIIFHLGLVLTILVDPKLTFSFALFVLFSRQIHKQLFFFLLQQFIVVSFLIGLKSS